MRAAAARVGNVTSWNKVNGPANTVVACINRLGWEMLSARQLRTDSGMVINLDDDPPVVIANEAKLSVRRWRWNRIRSEFPQLKVKAIELEGIGLGEGIASQEVAVDFAGVFKKVLAGKTNSSVFPLAEMKHIPSLRSAIVNGQWPRASRFTLPISLTILTVSFVMSLRAPSCIGTLAGPFVLREAGQIRPRKSSTL